MTTRMTDDGRLPCARCKAILPAEAFHRNKRLSTGYDCYCKECRNAYCRAWLAKQPESWKRLRTARTRAWEKAHPERKKAHERAYAAKYNRTEEAAP